jgi:hypothetical protein
MSFARRTLCTVADGEKLRQRDIADIAEEIVGLVDEGPGLSLFVLTDGRVDVVLVDTLSQFLMARDYASRMVGTYRKGVLKGEIVDDLRCFA